MADCISEMKNLSWLQYTPADSHNLQYNLFPIPIVQDYTYPMLRADDTASLLREIRDLQREQLAMMKAKQAFEERQKSMKDITTIAKMVFNVFVVVFVIAAFWYFYHTVYSNELFR